MQTILRQDDLSVSRGERSRVYTFSKPDSSTFQLLREAIRHNEVAPSPAHGSPIPPEAAALFFRKRPAFPLGSASDRGARTLAPSGGASSGLYSSPDRASAPVTITTQPLPEEGASSQLVDHTDLHLAQNSYNSRFSAPGGAAAAAGGRVTPTRNPPMPHGTGGGRAAQSDTGAYSVRQGATSRAGTIAAVSEDEDTSVESIHLPPISIQGGTSGGASGNPRVRKHTAWMFRGCLGFN